MPRNDQIRRQWRLWTILASAPAPMTANSLCRELGLGERSQRTIRRDLEVLREVGVPIRASREGREMRYAAITDGPELRLDGDALLALRIALGLMEPYKGTGVGQALEQIERCLESRMPARVYEHFAPLVGRLAVRSTAPPSLGPSEPVFAAVRRALTEGRQLEIGYSDLEGRSSTRTIHPQALVQGPRGMYLHALDARQGMALRTFRLERIQEARLLTPKGVRDESFDPSQHLAGSLGIFSPEHEARRFVLRVRTPRAAKLLRENPLHASQELVEAGDGTWRLRLELTSSTELLAHVLGMGGDVEAVEPVEFREAVTVALDRAQALYGRARGKRKVARSRSRSVRRVV